MPPHHRGFIRSLGHSLKSLLMGFIFSLEDKSNEWSTEDKLNVLSTAVSYASPSQGFHSLFGSFIEESFDGFHFLFRVKTPAQMLFKRNRSDTTVVTRICIDCDCNTAQPFRCYSSATDQMFPGCGECCGKLLEFAWMWCVIGRPATDQMFPGCGEKPRPPDIRQHCTTVQMLFKRNRSDVPWLWWICLNEILCIDCKTNTG